jgi:hypothetical protein
VIFAATHLALAHPDGPRSQARPVFGSSTFWSIFPAVFLAVF